MTLKYLCTLLKINTNIPTKDQSLKEFRCCRNTWCDSWGMHRTAKPLVTGIFTS